MAVFKCDRGKKSNHTKCIAPCFFYSSRMAIPAQCMMENQAQRVPDWKKCATHEFSERKTKAPNRQRAVKKESK